MLRANFLGLLEYLWGGMQLVRVLGLECASLICEAASHPHYPQLVASLPTTCMSHLQSHDVVFSQQVNKENSDM